MEITKREALTSVGIAALLLAVGIAISGCIADAQADQNEKYDKAVQISDSEIFQYGMRTDVGNAFVYGDLQAVDTVTFPEIGGEYMSVEKVKEKHTKHTRQVKHTRTVHGRTETYYTTETYWTWDTVSTEKAVCKEVRFCGAVFPKEKIKIPGLEYITTIKGSSKIRYKYYGTGTSFVGTVFTELRNGTISDNSAFYAEKTIEEAKGSLEGWDWRWLFWIFWPFVMGAAIYRFCYLKNQWLE